MHGYQERVVSLLVQTIVRDSTALRNRPGNLESKYIN